MQRDDLPLGRIGVWTASLDAQPFSRSLELVAELESLGYGAVWVPEAVGREALSNAALLLGGGERIVVATGIASIWARDAMAMAAGHRTVTSAHPGRFLLGMGVSHQVAVERLRGHDYQRPLATMRAYLEAMDSALYLAAPPPTEPVRVLAALRPRMLELAATRAAGAHPYFVPPEHTADARTHLGEAPLLCPEQAVLFETDPSRARELGRRHTTTYVGLPNYADNLRRFGMEDDDFAGGGSDRLIDAIVAWGDLDTIKARIDAHLDAGADHVCVQVLGEDLATPPLEGWRELSAAYALA